tara:strand:- start:1098 stop:1745 length:648 start_codon:yes stop_codon:yes gene_type:complete
MIYLVNYDAGNLLSIKRALISLKFEFSTIKTITNVNQNDILLIPGVGSFDSASKKMMDAGLIDMAKEKPANRPFIIGICLGMQLLMTYGLEGKLSKGLNLIKGSVESILSKKPKDLDMPKTLIGWEKFKTKNLGKHFQWLEKYQKNSFYHVHSYMCIPEKSENIIATYDDDLYFIPNIIGDLDNKALGLQFHPEKSGEAGLSLLKDIINCISKVN